MASTFTAFSATVPASTQTGTAFAVSANANDVALWYALVMGGNVPGWASAPVIGTGTAEQPQYCVFTNGVQRVRATNTWGTAAGAAGNLTQQVWEVSQDSGSTPNATGTWAAVATQVYTYDANGNLTATTGAGGTSSFLHYLIGKVKALLTAVTAHIAATSGVHGAGTMHGQDANAVAITGGALSNVTLDYVTARGKKIDLGNIAGSTAVNWNAGDYFYGTITSAAGALTFTNLPGAGAGPVGAITLKLTNPGVATSLWPAGTKWSSGTAPIRTVSGVDLYDFSCDDGATPRGRKVDGDSR
jgi:hypothetical protein